jgi:hypothetical protein
MTKTLNQIFFFLHQNQNIFLEKNHNPPFKLNGRSLILLSHFNAFGFIHIHLTSDLTVNNHVQKNKACIMKYNKIFKQLPCI